MGVRAVTGAALTASLAMSVALGLASAVEARRVTAAPPAASDRYVDVKGGRLHLVVLEPHGRAAGTLVLLHGASANLKDMEESLGKRLATRYRVVLVDRPGHGRSDRLGGREMASPARQGDAIVEALDKIGVGSAILVAHSWSGALATNLALDHADRVAGLVLLSPATHPWPGGVAWYNSIASTPLIGPLFVLTVIDPASPLFFEKAVASVFQPHAAPPDYVARTDARLVLRPAEFQANAEDLVDLKPFLETQAPRYGEIRVPTTIIVADKDTIVSPELHARALARQIAGAKLVVVKDAGHTTQWNATDRAIEEIDALAARTGR